MGEQSVSYTAADFKKRTLELEAFASLVDALRAAGPLTQERRTLLEQTASSFKITPDRYKAEIRRALSKPSLNGDQDEVTWALEGRRNTFMLPRSPPRSTVTAPYSAYTQKMRPALVKLPKNPCRSVETQTIILKPVANPKLLVVGSPRQQTTHTMVYAKPSNQHRQVRISPQGQHVPIVVNAKNQSKVVTVNSAIKPSGTVTSVNAQKASQHLVVNSATQNNRQIVLTTPNNIVQKLNNKIIPAAQVRPTIGTPVVTKVLNPNRTGELKIIQKPRVAQIRAGGTSMQLTPIGVRIGPINGKHQREQPPLIEVIPTKIIKSGTQWNYDDHSVMAKPAAVEPQSKEAPEAYTVKEIKGRTNPVPVKTVQVMQMSSNTQIAARIPKQTRITIPQTQICTKAREPVKNVVVQSLPYQNYQGTYVKMEEVIIEEEIA